jgi:pimeloyl-ACP methyl ester carboxylesterase
MPPCDGPDRTAVRAVLDHPVVSGRMFYPRREHLQDPFWVKAADGSSLACHRHEAGPDSPTVVFFHGNGEVVADFVPELPSLLARLGCSSVLVEYRGFGRSTGRPGLQAMVDDVAAVLSAIDVPDSRLILYGRSIGSIAAIRGVRLRPRAAGLVIDSGIFDVLEGIARRVTPDELGVDAETLAAEVARELDPSRALAEFRGRSLILHTRHDDAVDLRHAERLFETARQPKELVVFERGDHNSIFEDNRADYAQALGDLIRCCRGT